MTTKADHNSPTIRTDQEWLDSLKGGVERNAQAAAIDDLANYLYVVSYNYLKTRKKSIAYLNSLADEEIGKFAADYVQEFLEKLIVNDFALVDKYNGIGKFTVWAAQIVINLISSDLRKASWVRQRNSVRSKSLFPDLENQLDTVHQQAQRNEAYGLSLEAGLFRKYEKQISAFAEELRLKEKGAMHQEDSISFGTRISISGLLSGYLE